MKLPYRPFSPPEVQFVKLILEIINSIKFYFKCLLIRPKQKGPNNEVNNMASTA